MSEINEILWFIPAHGDGPYIGTEIGKRLPSHDYLEQVATAIDSIGFDGALIPTGFGCEDSWVVAASLIPVTKRMKFLIAFRPGSMSPTLAARMAATFDRMSNGRLLLNIITGGDPVELAGDGTFLSHDERYVVTDEFLTIFRSIMQMQSIDLEGKYERVKGAKINFPPVQKPYPPLYFGGSSPAGMAVAAKHIDVYLTLAEPPAMLKEKIDRMRELADKEGRTIRYGLRVHMFVRERAEDAWREAERVLRHATPEQIAASQEKLARFDSVGQGRMKGLHNGSRETLEVSPNLWAGIGLINKGIGTALVGDPDTIVERMMEYVDIGIDTFILSSYPHLEEMYHVGELVLPRLPGWKAKHKDDVFSQANAFSQWQ